MATSPQPPVRALVVANPAAAGGKNRDRALQEAAGVLSASGWTVSWRWTEHSGHAEQVAAEAAGAGLDVVAVAGGDGTVHEVANGLAGTGTAMAVIPAGTGNVLAAQLGLVGIPTPLHRPDPPWAARELVAGHVRRVDTGFARPKGMPGRHFLLWAGVGLDAAIAAAVEGEARQLKKVIGPAAYGAVGLRELAQAAGTPALVRLDARTVRDRLVLGVVANIPLYAGAVELTPEAKLDDGLLDVELFLGQGWWSLVRHMHEILVHRKRALGTHSASRASRVRLLTTQALPLHLDAEPYGATPVDICVRPTSLRLLVPRCAPLGLFTGPAEPILT